MAARAVLYAAVVAAVLGPAAGQVQCKDENGNAVDWWAMFKLPNGYKAAFWTSAEANNGLNVNADLSSAGNPLQETLSGVWDNQGHVLYNDENPESGLAAKAASNASSLRSADWVKYGHTKGVLAFDGSTGFWLVHSVPRFPQANDWSYPEDETIYGQSFLCVSLDAGGIEDVGGLLVLNKPSVYASNLPSSYADQFPSLQRVLAKQWHPTPFANHTILESTGGQSFVAFAKNGQWNKELYADLVAPFFKSGMMTETWIRDPVLPSYCPSSGQDPPFEVREVRSLTVGGTSYDYTQDHSKWGLVEGAPYVCIGDINRMVSQASRGGGTVCIENKGLWSALSGAVSKIDSC